MLRRIIESARTYYRYARLLSKHWDRSLADVAFKLAMSRLLYARGPREFDVFRFTCKPLREWKRYITRGELLALQEPVAPVAFRPLDQDKILFANRCAAAGLAAVPNLAFIAPSGGEAAPGDTPTVRSGEEIERFLPARGDFDGFAKPRSGGEGYGVFPFARRAGRYSWPSGSGVASDLFAYCATSPFGRDGYLLQERILPHPDLLPLMPGPALGTVRVLTFLQPDGGVEIPWAALKVPAPGAVADNWRFGGLFAGVDVPSGKLLSAVGPSPERPVTHDVERHATTGARFVGFALPHWPEVLALVERAARAFAVLPALGWDVAITPQGPLLLEANWAFAIFAEYTLDRGCAEETRRLFGRVVGG
jgi:hypothetical protein